MSFLKNLFGEKVNCVELVQNGATLIDVRTHQEFKAENVKGSKNIPLDIISDKANEIADLKKPIVLCCKSGMRSGRATALLKRKGLTEVYNGGAYTNFL